MRSILGLMATCALGVLVFLSTLELQHSEPPSAAPATPPVAPGADLPARVERVTAALGTLALPLPTPAEIQQGAGALRWTHRRYEVTLRKPDNAGDIDQLFEPLRRASAGVTVQTSAEANGAKVQVGVDGLLTHTLIFHWLAHAPRAAIIVDHLGDDLLIARALAGIEAPLTFAVRSSRPFSHEVAELASVFHREVLLQLPAPSEHPSGATAAAAGSADLLRWFDQNVAAVPHTAGITLDTGTSSATNATRQQWIFGALKQKDLFVVAEANSRARTCDAAATAAVGCVGIDVVITDSGDEQRLRDQLDEILQAARTRGDVVAIGHATPALASALQAALPAFAAAEVELVPASKMLADRSLSPQ